MACLYWIFSSGKGQLLDIGNTGKFANLNNRFKETKQTEIMEETTVKERGHSERVRRRKPREIKREIGSFLHVTVLT